MWLTLSIIHELYLPSFIGADADVVWLVTSDPCFNWHVSQGNSHPGGSLKAVGSRATSTASREVWRLCV